MTTVEERFWAKVDRSGDCWIWTASTTKNGYGLFDKGVNRRAHRWAWADANGPIPAGLCVLHRCDTRACVRPDHLFVGTQKDNIHDAMAKGRHKIPIGVPLQGARPGDPPRGCTKNQHGERNLQAKLTEAQVVHIRSAAAAGERQCDIARRLSLPPTTIGDIVRRRRWAHVE